MGRAKGYFSGTLGAPRMTLVLDVPLPLISNPAGRDERGSGEADSPACPESEEDTGLVNDHTYSTSLVSWLINAFQARSLQSSIFLIPFRVAMFIVSDVFGRADLPHHYAWH